LFRAIKKRKLYRNWQSIQMTLVFTNKTPCVLCGEVILPGDEIVGTSHFIDDKNDPLWKYSDAAFHKTCFTSWEKRAEFVSKFNSTVESFVLAMANITKCCRTDRLF